MATEQLATYLNDHLAGAVGALELMSHIEEDHAGTSIGEIVAGIRVQVEREREQLEQIIGRLDGRQSVPRKAAAWIGERLLRLKLRIDDPSGGAFRLFEAIEVIAIGVHGKDKLWRTLRELAPRHQRLQDIDYEALLTQSGEQQASIETARLEAARAAFGG